MTVAKGKILGHPMTESPRNGRMCCSDVLSCQDPEKCYLRMERGAFLESLLAVSPLSEGDAGFLFAFFDFGPGGSEVVDLRDFALMFGMDEPEKVPLRVAILLERLKERTRKLGYHRADLY